MLDETTGTAIAPSVGGDTGGEGTTTESTATPTGDEELTGTPTTGDDAAGGEADQTPTDSETTPEAESTTGEKGPKLPKHIAALKETDPAAYKAAKADFFELNRRRSDFRTAEEASKAKQSLDLVGGAVGLAEMQEDNAEFSKVAKQFVNGDPEFAKDLFAQDSIAAAQHVPSMLSELRANDEGAYNRLIAKQFSEEFRANAIMGGTLYQALENVYKAIPEGEAGDGARKLLNAIAQWHNKINQIAKQEENPEVKKLRERIKQDEQARADEGRKQFFNDYRDKAVKFNNEEANRLVDQFLGGRKLDKESRNLALNNTISLANDLLNDGKTFPEFAKQRALLFQRGDPAALLRYVNSAWKQALEMSIKRVARLVGGSPAAAARPGVTGEKKPAPAAPGREVGFVRINSRPDPREIDRSKSDASMILGKRAILKDGRKVSWAHIA